MSEKVNSYCTICGNGYHLCISCKDKIKLSPWKVYTDTAEHYKIHQILHGLSCNIYTKDEAKDKLKNVDLSDLETFKPNIKKIVKDILNEDQPIVKTIEEIKPIEGFNEIEITKVKENTIEKPIISRKRNYKAEIE